MSESSAALYFTGSMNIKRKCFHRAVRERRGGNPLAVLNVWVEYLFRLQFFLRCLLMVMWALWCRNNVFWVCLWFSLGKRAVWSFVSGSGSHFINTVNACWPWLFLDTSSETLLGSFLGFFHFPLLSLHYCGCLTLQFRQPSYCWVDIKHVATSASNLKLQYSMSNHKLNKLCV